MTQTIQIEGARTRVALDPAHGGRIAQIETLQHGAWVALLHEPVDISPDDRDPLSWGSFVMAPWPNRVANARFEWRGEVIELPANLGSHAVHGLCFDRAWTIEATNSAACVMRIAFDGRWPFGGYAIQRVEALDDGVAQTVEIHAEGAAFPAGAGWHPWFRRDLRGAGHVHAQVDADMRYELHENIPTGRMIRVDGEHDLRGYPALGARRLDDCYLCHNTELRLRWGDVELWMESSPNVSHAVVYTPRHAVCLEPQTCATDAFNLRDADAGGVRIVEPARPLGATTRWRWATAEPPGGNRSTPQTSMMRVARRVPIRASHGQ